MKNSNIICIAVLKIFKLCEYILSNYDSLKISLKDSSVYNPYIARVLHYFVDKQLTLHKYLTHIINYKYNSLVLAVLGDTIQYNKLEKSISQMHYYLVVSLHDFVYVIGEVIIKLS